MTEAPGEPGGTQLRKAAALVATRVPADIADGRLERLTEEVGRVIGGADPGPAREWVAADPVILHLIQAITYELLQPPEQATGSSAGRLAALCALAVVQPGPAVYATTVQDLESAMRGADAYELLVEVAHDFRSPLTSILFLAEALRDGHSGPVNETQRSQLGLVYSAAFGLAAIASDVMDLARRESDLIGPEAEPFALSEVFATVERMVRPLVEEKGLDLRVVAPERARSRGHPHALTRVLLNLTTNALKFTDVGSVEIGARALHRATVEYYVEDTGRGISREQQRRLFQPFIRRPGSPDRGSYFSGSGVGLSITRRLLRAMGSDLRLDFSDDGGTRFSFELPVPKRGETSGGPAAQEIDTKS